MDFSKVLKELRIMFERFPIPRLLLLWALVLTVVFTWQAGNIFSGLAAFILALK
jgi:hypothetical protein